MSNSTNTKDYCTRCQQKTNHKLLYTFKEYSTEDEINWEDNHDVIQCLGCEKLQFRNRFSHEDMYFYNIDGDIEYYEESKYFPRNIQDHAYIKNIYSLPDKLRVVYNETIEALRNSCYLLSGVGLRAIIEAVCLDQNISGRNLEVKINNLVKNKLITEKDGSRLHSIRFLGNDSVHEMDVPKEEKLRVALDIVEHLLKNLYLIDIDANLHLDTMITQYEDFKSLLLIAFRNKTILKGEEKTIKEVIQKDFRRIETTYLSNFINQIKNEIQNNIITSIIIGKFDNNQQYFIKN
ncbi:DUF4145 domain-containing protein [Chryseobacterium sp.]|uniref:DUF4145 domain-containing protein n=1 Tax=Chryseobacterium sp. TaxID=1871047 RepID=UPI0024E2101E|nr:DUF4145 domain-containing protein [Chryseobacterium sp.]